MRSLRNAVRPKLRVVGVILTVLISLVILVMMWLVLFWNQSARRAVQQWTTRIWGRSVLWVLNAKVTVIGEPPKGGAFLVANHLSYVDIPLIAHVLPPRFVAKMEIRSWPGLGWACRLIETIFVDRSKKRDTVRVGNEIKAGLARGDNIVLFPEGTSGPGHDLLRFKPPLLAPVADAEIPVHYAALTYTTTPPDPPSFLSIAWWADVTFGAHCPVLLALDSWEATLTFGKEPITNSDRKELAIELREAISLIFEPLVDFEPESPDNPVPKMQAPPATTESPPPPTVSTEQLSA